MEKEMEKGNAIIKIKYILKENMKMDLKMEKVKHIMMMIH